MRLNDLRVVYLCADKINPRSPSDVHSNANEPRYSDVAAARLGGALSPVS